MYVANSGSGTVSLINSSNNIIVDTIRLGSALGTLEFNPSNNNMYVADWVDNTVSILGSS